MRLPVTSFDPRPILWTPIARLPSALRLELADPGALEPARGPMSELWRPSPLRFVVVYVALAAAALRVVSRGPNDDPFESPGRFALVAAAVALPAFGVAWGMWRRLYGPDRSPGPGLLLTSTALVVVDSHAVAVLPAEHLEARPDGHGYRDALVTDRAHGEAWAERLDETVRRARFDAQARRDDPWRSLEGLPARTSLAAARLPLLRGAAVALAGGALVAAGVELGPMRERQALRVRAEERQFTEALRGDADLDGSSLRATPAALPHDPTAGDARPNDEAAAASRRRFAALTARALAGSEDDARAWLRFGPQRWRDATWLRVHTRLQTRCEARYPLDGVPAQRRLFRHAQRLRCVDPDQRIRVEAHEVAVERDGGSDPRYLELRTPRAVAAPGLARRLAMVFRGWGDDTEVRLSDHMDWSHPYLFYLIDYREVASAGPAPRVRVREVIMLRDAGGRLIREPADVVEYELPWVDNGGPGSDVPREVRDALIVLRTPPPAY